jgi:hypothetical protein
VVTTGTNISGSLVMWQEENRYFLPECARLRNFYT